MVSISVAAQADYEPPRMVMSIHASSGGILESCEVARVQDLQENLIRKQPISGVSDVTVYDYESLYGVPASYSVRGLERIDALTAVWTGDANNSASILKQNANNIATNLVPDPSWTSGTPRSWNAQLTKIDSSWQITKTDIRGTFYPFGESPTKLSVNTDYVAVARISGNYDYSQTFAQAVGVSNTNAQRVGDLVVWQFHVDTINSKNLFFLIDLSSTPSLLSSVGVYTAVDWQVLQTLGINCFSGSFSRPAITNQFDVASSSITLKPQSGWLIHPGNPAKSMRLPIGHIVGIGDNNRRSTSTRHDILGAKYPIFTVPGPRRSQEFDLKLRTKNSDEEQSLFALFEDQTPILINWLFEDARQLNMKPMYLQMLDVNSSRFTQMVYPRGYANTPDLWREWLLPCVEVNSPAVSQQAVGWTYAQLLSENMDYRTVSNTYNDYADLQANTTKAP